MAISKHDKQALADLFIHMGVPLVVAMQTVESWSGAATEDISERAQKLSKLLTIAVEFATKITKKLEIRDAYTLENVRGKIIRIVTPIIAEGYVNAGEIPTEDSLGDLTDLFDVLLSFAGSVSPTDEKGSKATKTAMMVEACSPLLTAIRDNDLGMGADKAFQESIAGIQGRADQLANAMGIANPIEDGLFKSVVTIFVSCYNQKAKSGGDMDAIWAECDQRLALIQGLTAYVGEKAKIEVTKKPNAEPKKEGSKTVKKAEPEPDKDNEKDSDTDNEGDDDNPMSFFS